MKTKILLISLLCIGLLSCEKDNKEVIRDDLKIDTQNNPEDDFEDESDYENVNYPQGAVKGVFSVSENKKVAFSQGNLQYQASTNTWRFAEHQYDMVGVGYGQIDVDHRCYVAGNVLNSDNREISSTYNGWIDLFGWGTGNNPTNSSEAVGDYSTFVDWGVNKISNGGNVENTWFTLSDDEWSYLINTRDNARSKRGVAEVNGIPGLVLLPDNWTLPSGVEFIKGAAEERGYEYYKTVNAYTVSEWEIMEAAGAVFLPAAGNRHGTGVDNVGGHSRYWSCTEYDTYNSSDLVFYSDEVKYSSNYRSDGQSVRLCAEFDSNGNVVSIGNQENTNNNGISKPVLPGLFSVSVDKKIQFSQGNLQYQASTNTWRFAEHQYDYISDGNANISPTYSGWIDLFGWGTGNNPTNSSEAVGDYSTFVDWGVNEISNDGDVANVWFTLSNDEWNYLLSSRPNANDKKGMAEVNGINGLVLLPDTWTLPNGAEFTSGAASGYGSEYYKTVNAYTVPEWQAMEEAGAVFLPAAGYRHGTGVDDVDSYGNYWSYNKSDLSRAYYLYFVSNEVNTNYYSRSSHGLSVRLCVESR